VRNDDLDRTVDGAVAAVAALGAICTIGMAVIFLVWGLTWMNGHGASAADIAPAFLIFAVVLFGLAWGVVRATVGREAVAALGSVRLGISVALAFLVGPTAILLDVAFLHGVVHFRIKHPAAGLEVIVPTLLLFSIGWVYATKALLRGSHPRRLDHAPDTLA
jgi:hypothetical protein